MTASDKTNQINTNKSDGLHLDEAHSRWGALRQRVLNYFSKLREWILETVLPQIPGTRKFRRRIQKLMVKHAREGLQLFIELEAVDFDTKQLLQKRIRFCENKLAVLRGRKAANWHIVILTYWVGSVILYLGIPIIGIGWLNIGFSYEKFISFVVSYVLTVVAALAIFLAPFIILSKIRNLLRGHLIHIVVFPSMVGILLFYVLVINSAITVARTNPLENVILYGIISGILSVIGYGIIFFGISIWSQLFELVQNRWMEHRSPDLIVINKFIKILSTVEKNPMQWGELDFRQQLLYGLEEVARNISPNLSRCLRSGDTVTDAWFDERTRQMAAAIRALKKWVLTPRPETRDEFIRRIASNLICSANGNWDGFEQIQPEKLSRSQHLFRITILFRIILSATLPLIIFGVVQQTPFALDGIVAEYVTVGVFIWAALTLLATLDPLFNEKIDTLKDVTQLIPFSGKSSQKTP